MASTTSSNADADAADVSASSINALASTSSSSSYSDASQQQQPLTTRDTVHTIVIDANVLIKASPRSLDALNPSAVLTVPEVIAEIRDRRARHALASTPALTDIRTRVPDDTSIRAVIAFAKRTGDYHALSITDIRVLALTYMLDRDAHNGSTSHIRTDPRMPVQGTRGRHQQSSYNKSTSSLTSKQQIKEEEKEEQKKAEDFKEVEEQKKEEVKVKEEKEEEEKEEKVDEEKVEEEKVEEVKVEETEVFDEEGDDGEYDDGEDDDEDEEEEDPGEDQGQDQVEREAEGGEERKEEDEDDGEGEWITPSNVKKFKSRDQGFHAPSRPRAPEVIPVACLTSDFAMQNVLLQMNLRLLSIDGVQIRQAKSWVLRCHACYKITTDFTKKFCPWCGNNTLIRTSVSVDADGNVVCYLKKNFQYNIRGTVYSVPTPKGGRKNTDLILREDQKEFDRAQRDHRAKLKQAMNEGLGADDREALSDRRTLVPEVVIGFGRKNPNARRGRRR